MAVFWDVAPCSLVEVYQRLRGVCCLHHQGDEMMEAISTSETLVNFYQTTRRYIPEDSHLHTHRHGYERYGIDWWKNVVSVRFKVYTSSQASNKTLIAITDSTEQSSSWEANIRSGSQEIIRMFMNPTSHNPTHKRQSQDPVLNPVHTITFYFLNIYFNIILSSTSTSYAVFLFQVFRLKFCMHFSSPPCVLHAPFSSSSSISQT
jgi:hypothetical protein